MMISGTRVLLFEYRDIYRLWMLVFNKVYFARVFVAFTLACLDVFLSLNVEHIVANILRPCAGTISRTFPEHVSTLAVTLSM